MDDILNIDDLERWAHLQELESAASGVLSGGEVDPLRILLDPDENQPWEYEQSKTDFIIPGTLHPKQLEALLNEERFKWLFWANQSGKTTLGAIDTALTALGRHLTSVGSRLYCCGPAHLRGTCGKTSCCRNF